MLRFAYQKHNSPKIQNRNLRVTFPPLLGLNYCKARYKFLQVSKDAQERPGITVNRDRSLGHFMNESRGLRNDIQQCFSFDVNGRISSIIMTSLR